VSKEKLPEHIIARHRDDRRAKANAERKHARYKPNLLDGSTMDPDEDLDWYQYRGITQPVETP
jgi:hypothetical protein